MWFVVQEKCETVFEDIPMDGKMEQKDDEQRDMILVVLKQVSSLKNTSICLIPNLFHNIVTVVEICTTP